MPKKKIYATIRTNSGAKIRLAFVDRGDHVFLYSPSRSYGGFELDRFGEKLDRSWIREFAKSSNSEVVGF